MKKTRVKWLLNGDLLFIETLYVADLPPVGRLINYAYQDMVVSSVKEFFGSKDDDSEGLDYTEVRLTK